MKQEIVARVKIDPTDPNNPQVIVRKAVFSEDGTVKRKYGLSRDGDWIEVGEAVMYPDECLLPVAVWKE